MSGVEWRGNKHDDAGGVAFLDFDLDGVDELAVAAPHVTQMGWPPVDEDTHGRIYLLNEPYLGDLLESQAWGILDPVHYEVSGPHVVHAVPDANGDGSPDLVTFDGQWLLVAGPLLAGVHSLADAYATSPTNDFSFDSSCGDVDGNQISELCGFGRVFFGPIPPGALDDAAPQAELMGLTYHVTSAADLDGDSFSEVMVAGGDFKTLYLLDDLGPGLVDVPTAAAASWQTNDADQLMLGSAVGDVGGDGIEDFVATLRWPDRQEALLITEAVGADTRDIASRIDMPTDAVWQSVGGDFNGDGQRDLAMGTGYLQASLSIYLGPLPDALLTQADAAVVYVGELDREDMFASSLAASDLDGDQVDDLAVGAPRAYSGPPGQPIETARGAVHLLFAPGIAP